MFTRSLFTLSMIGTTVSHYRITAELGRGGMGVVYAAEGCSGSNAGSSSVTAA